jgi:hypothetical protein
VIGTVAALWRHPIKSHGREALKAVTLIAGQTMPYDRRWAVTSGASQYQGGWDECHTFMIGTRNPALAAISAKLDEDAGTLHMRHPDLHDIVIQPGDPAGAAAFIAWVAPLTQPGRAAPQTLVTAGVRGMTDTKYPSVSLMNTASHVAVADQLGRPLEPERWRGNIWLDGLAPWTEWDWLGRNIRIGAVVLRIEERIARCAHTAASPQTGLRDADTLGALRDGWTHTDFGVYAAVITGGRIALGDELEVL